MAYYGLDVAAADSFTELSLPTASDEGTYTLDIYEVETAAVQVRINGKAVFRVASGASKVFGNVTKAEVKEDSDGGGATFNWAATPEPVGNPRLC